MLIAALEFTLRRSREIVLRTLYAPACRGIKSGQRYMVKHLRRPAIAEPRQLTVNTLYLTLHYADSRSSSLWGKTSQDHLASPVVAVVPNYCPLSCV